jgi:hypothetical protein
LKLEELLGLINVLFYLLHFTIFFIITRSKYKTGGLNSALLILFFLLIIFFISLQIGSFLGQLPLLGKDMTARLKAIHDTLSIMIGTIIETPIWFVFLKKKKEKADETTNDSTNSAR